MGSISKNSSCRFRTPLLLAAAFFSSSAFAQWIGYPTANVPRKADGSVNMSAPAPRLANGKPDLSGIWISDRTPEGEESPSDVYTLPTSRFMNNMGVDMPDGLPYQDWLKPIVKRHTENMAIEDPHIRCLPDTFLRAYGMPHMLKFVHTPGLFVTLNELNAGYRQVFVDGRALPDDPSPGWQGYSSAVWEGDTMVIDSIGFRDDTWIDWNGSVLTEQAKVREEITRPDYGHIKIHVTVDDPGAYTRPWSVDLVQRIVVDGELIDEICLENERFVEHMDLEY
jgi:hypothetical protein